MDLLRRSCISRNKRALILFIESLMCADSSECCMVSSKHPRAWYTRINSYLTSLGFTISEADENPYHILVEGKLFIIVLYVDNLF